MVPLVSAAENNHKAASDLLQTDNPAAAFLEQFDDKKEFDEDRKSTSPR